MLVVNYYFQDLLLFLQMEDFEFIDFINDVFGVWNILRIIPDRDNPLEYLSDREVK